MVSTRLSAHIGYLFTELPLVERVRASAEAGFMAVEHPQPFGIPPARMLSELRQYDLAFSQIAAAVGDPSKGEKGLAALPGREREFRDSFRQSLDYALEIGCPLIHPMAGTASETTQDVKRTYLRNIEFAVELTAELPVKVLIEAISHAAVPGYYMGTLEQAVVVQEIYGPGNLALFVDTFHAAANAFDVVNWVGENAFRIGHVHIADHPGRHEPGTGEFPFETFLQALRSEEYDGAIGFEYIPRADTSSGLDFLPAWKREPIAASRAAASEITARGSI